MTKDTIVLGGGCFLCTEAIFQRLKGVLSVSSGYAGGNVANPTYEMVCMGRTGHAEVVLVEYDSSVIALRDLLEVFFATHDPTSLNRQGADEGTQYRSAIYYTNTEQKLVIDNFLKELSEGNFFGRPIVTEIKLLDKFYPAEAYHKDYYNQNPGQGYCQAVINPKLKKFKEKFSALAKE